MRAIDIYSAIGNVSSELLEESEFPENNTAENPMHRIKKEICAEENEIIFRRKDHTLIIASTAACIAAAVIGINILVNLNESGVISESELSTIKSGTTFSESVMPDIVSDEQTEDYSEFFRNAPFTLPEFVQDQKLHQMTGQKINYSFGNNSDYLRSVLPFDTSEFKEVTGFIAYVECGKDEVPQNALISLYDLPADPQSEEYPHSKYIHIIIYPNSTEITAEDGHIPVNRFGTDVYCSRDINRENVLHTSFLLGDTGYRVTYGNMTYDEIGKITDQIISSGSDLTDLDLSKADKYTYD